MSKNTQYDVFNLDTEKQSGNYITIVSSDSDIEPESEKNITKKPSKIDVIKNDVKVKEKTNKDDQSKDSVEWFSVSIKYTATMMEAVKVLKNENNTKSDIVSKQTINKVILDTILQNVSPHKFVPCLCNEYQRFYNFYVFDCVEALNKLHSLDYVCISEKIPNFRVKLKVLATSPYKKNLKVSQIVQTGLKKRFDTYKNCLDLNNFMMESCVKNTIYFPLWYVGNQKIISAEMEDIIPSSIIDNVDLSYNNISCFNGFDMNAFGSLKKLDISRNKIMSIRALAPFHGIYVQSLVLGFNPLCHDYHQKQEYIKSVKLIFPTVKYIDEHDVSPGAIPKSVKNYAIDKNSTAIVGKFLEIYFSLFDSGDRCLMMDLYGKESLLSLSSLTPDSIFAKRERNILKKNMTNIFVGPRSITGILLWMPRTEHDPMSFCVDVIFYSEKCIILTVNGLFKVPSDFITENEPVYQFSRNFILLKDAETSAYKISNDMLSVIPNVTPQPDSFKLTVKIGNKLSLTPTSTLTDSTKKSLVEMLSKVTELPATEAYECLTVCQWNFQLAVKHAITLIKNKN